MLSSMNVVEFFSYFMESFFPLTSLLSIVKQTYPLSIFHCDNIRLNLNCVLSFQHRVIFFQESISNVMFRFFLQKVDAKYY